MIDYYNQQKLIFNW